MNNCQSIVGVELGRAFLGASHCTQGIIVAGVVVLVCLILAFLCYIIPKVAGSTIGILCEHFVSIMGKEIRSGIKNASGVERADYIVLLLILIGLVVVISVSVLGGMRGTGLILIVGVGIFALLCVSILSVLLVYFERDKVERLKKLRAIAAT